MTAEDKGVLFLLATAAYAGDAVDACLLLALFFAWKVFAPLIPDVTEALRPWTAHLLERVQPPVSRNEEMATTPTEIASGLQPVVASDGRSEAQQRFDEIRRLRQEREMDLLIAGLSGADMHLTPEQRDAHKALRALRNRRVHGYN